MSTASGIATGLITLLSAGSVFGANMVTRDDYSVLERCSGSCAVVSIKSVRSTTIAFAGDDDKERVWTAGITAYAKDYTGNPTTILDTIFAITDTVIECLDSDDRIQNNVSSTQQITILRNKDQYYNIGGAVWAAVEIEVQMLEL